MKKLRFLIPFWGILALFFQLPETPNLFGGCKTCVGSDPYLPLIGAGYFAFLIALFVFFPTFPHRTLAKGGLLWAVLLAAALTYLSWLSLCAACLIAHGCHILMWVGWMAPSKKRPPSLSLSVRWYLSLLAPIAIIALFSCMNLSLMVYHVRSSRIVTAPSLKIGDTVPAFKADTRAEPGMVINFISPDCPYCKEQLLVLNAVAGRLKNHRFITVTPAIPSNVEQFTSNLEWVIDKDESLQQVFQVSGYPTLFVIGKDNKIAQVIPGVPEQLRDLLLSSLN